MTGKRPWSDLFVKHTFFTSGYKYYISVISTSKTEQAHKTWSGYVESKVRMLVQKLEQHPSIALAHAFNKGYERRHRCTTDEQVHQIQEGCLDFLAGPNSPPVAANAQVENGDVPPKTEAGTAAKQQDEPVVKQENGAPGPENGNPAKESEEAEAEETKPPQELDIYTTTHYIGLELAPGRYPEPAAPNIGAILPPPWRTTDVDVSLDAKSLDLSYQVNEFKSLCTAWQKYQDELQSVATIGVQHCRK